MNLFVAVVMLVMVPLVCTAEDSPHPGVKETKPKIEEPQLDKAKTRENQPVVSAVDVKPGAGQHDADYQTDKQKADPAKPVDYQWWFNLFLVILTGGLVITGALQVRVYREQARYMREQARYMHDGLEVTRQSAKAAQDSADAAMKTAMVTEEALKLTERAYLTIGHWRWSNPEAAHPGTISFFLTNTGRTPARLFGYFIERCVDRRPSTITPEYRQRLIAGRQGLMIAVQQRQEVPVDQNDPLPPVQWQQIRDGAISLYVFAHIEYDDVFEERYEVGCLVRYDWHAREFLIHANTAYNYNRKKNNQ